MHRIKWPIRHSFSIRSTAIRATRAALIGVAISLSSGLLALPAEASSLDPQNSAIERLQLGSTLPAPKYSELGVLIAQDDTYDPFADYSEFEESMEEEEDINFFRNGRLLTLGFQGGFRGWTQTLSSIYTSNISFGLFACYFFDLRFALQFGFTTSDHIIQVTSPSTTAIRGTVGITDLSFNMKYYFNTQNVTRGLAELNPFILGGFSQVYRTIVVTGNSNFAKDSAFGFNLGGGIEVPMMRNKMFFGLQGLFQYLMFADENKIILDENDVKTGVSPVGDSFQITGVIGVNF
ncbi:MAG TPA: hypothetical protein PLZ57_05500 [Pseudobdellovibrionaceae bacterium]|nr:hypothetical protein [Pseudobdellovibrionaceae bacterium]